MPSFMNDPTAISGVGVWAMNIFSSVGIIMVNKQVMSVLQYKFATTLTGMHFIVTGLVGFLLVQIGYLVNKTVIPMADLIMFAFVANVSVVSMNVSLMLNSVGFYQISKLSIIPTVCVLESFINNKKYSNEVKGSVVVVMIGVGICTITDFHMNTSGLITAAVSVLTTAMQQIYIGMLQKKHNVGSFDLLSKTSPIQAVMLLCCGPFVDYFLTSMNVLAYRYTLFSVIFISLSCILAIFVNLSQYLCIGKFSATTFQVLGHMKTVFVLLLGWLLFDSKMTLKNLGGILVAVLGMVLYGWAVERSKAAAALEATAISPKKDTEETVPLVPLRSPAQ